MLLLDISCHMSLPAYHISSQIMAVNVDVADECCKALLMDCESWAETSANAERCGNISQAIIDCQQAIG